MSRCPFPEHHQSSGGGGVGPLVAVVLAVVFAAAVAAPVARAADSVARVVAEVLTVAVLVVASAVGLAALAGLAVVAVRVRRRILGGPLAVPRRAAAEVVADRQAAGLPDHTARVLPAAHARVLAFPCERVGTRVVTSADVGPTIYAGHNRIVRHDHTYCLPGECPICGGP